MSNLSIVMSMLVLGVVIRRLGKIRIPALVGLAGLLSGMSETLFESFVAQAQRQANEVENWKTCVIRVRSVWVE
jgi:hypothetical protein